MVKSYQENYINNLNEEIGGLKYKVKQLEGKIKESLDGFELLQVENVKLRGTVKEKREYKKHSFCRSMYCLELINDTCAIDLDRNCKYTAKQFHKWLKNNKIL